MFPLRYAALVLATLPLLPEPARASAELAQARNCVACHHVERRMIGPPYRAIAERYAQDSTAPATLAARIVAGAGGVWGRMPMPAQPQVSPAEAQALAEWILAQR